MAKNKNLKRKPTPFIKENVTKPTELPKDVESEEDSGEDESSSENEFINNIENDDNNDDTDNEENEELFTSDDEDDLDFESDTEGNFNLKNVSNSNGNNDDVDELVRKSDTDAENSEDDAVSDVDDDDDDDDDDEELDDEDSESVEDEDDNESEKEEEEETNDFKIEGDSSVLDNSAEPESINMKPTKHIKKKSKVKKSLNGTTTTMALKKAIKEHPTTSESNNNEEENDEYKDDTSDEEDIRNTIGNIPMHWYDDYKHLGYDWDARKIMKPASKDQLDTFLSRMEDPNFWRTVKDNQTGQNVILSEDDITLIKRIFAGKLPDDKFDDFKPWVEWFTSTALQMPIRNVPDHKRSFLPSKSEKKKVSKMVHALKMGWMKTIDEVKKEKAKKGPQFYMLWETDTEREKMRRIHDHVSAPKRDLPGHAESYNPPAEYLFDEKEIKEWHKFKDEPSRRKLHFLPQKYKSLREVPAYPRYLRERFLRCLDLYLCPRAKRMKLTIDSEYLIPKLPSAKDLQPFPTVESMVYTGHTDMIRTISVEPNGEYFVSGSDDTTVKIWEIKTGRCIRTIETGDIVRSVAWCPNVKLSLIAVASGNRVILLNPKVGDKVLIKKTDDILAVPPNIDSLETERIKAAVQWNAVEDKNEYNMGFRIILTHFKSVKQVTWHGKGDYFATVMPDGANRSTLINQLSKRRSQVPFSKSKGLIQCVLFHPVKPCLFVATQKNVRIYDLVKQELVKKLLSNCKWISDMAIHPKGDNLLVSTYDKKMLWFDLDLSTKPYQTIRLHKNAVRSSAYHLRYPLFASAGDDQSVIVSHGMVYNDLIQNPLIVPLKKLQTHKPFDEFGVFDVMWHPTQPWVFSSGADSTIRLYT